MAYIQPRATTHDPQPTGGVDLYVSPSWDAFLDTDYIKQPEPCNGGIPGEAPKYVRTDLTQFGMVEGEKPETPITITPTDDTEGDNLPPEMSEGVEDQ